MTPEEARRAFEKQQILGDVHEILNRKLLAIEERLILVEKGRKDLVDERFSDREKIEKLLAKSTSSGLDAIRWADSTKNTIPIELDINEYFNDIESLIEQEREDIVELLKERIRFRMDRLSGPKKNTSSILELGLVLKEFSNIREELTQKKEGGNKE